MTRKEKYYSFCEIEKNIPIFSQAWWLDAVCGMDWNVALVEKNSQIIASMPYYLIKKVGFKIITMPKLTQNMGPYIKYPPNQKYENKIAYEKIIMTELITYLPSYDMFSQNFNYTITNWLPFYWKGFSQTTYYSYILDQLSDLESIFSRFHSTKKKNIKKAEKLIDIVYDISDKTFYDNHKMTLAKQGKKISYSLELFKKIYSEGYKHNSSKTIGAYDKNGNLHAAYFIIWDDISVYNLISTIDPEYRESGASSLLFKEIISFASNISDKIDLEGSMIESVEQSFRKFGAIQIPYFNVTKINSTLLGIKKMFNDLIIKQN